MTTNLSPSPACPPESAAPTIAIGPIAVHDLTLPESVEYIIQRILTKHPIRVVTPNLDHVLLVSESEDFRAAYREADLRLADGMPLLWMSKLRGTPLRERVAGSDLFPHLLRAANREGLRVLVIGGSELAAQRALKRMRAEFPRLRAECVSPRFGFEQSNSEMAQLISDAKHFQPDLTFLCLGSPKSELLLKRLSDEIASTAVVSVGAAIDFYAQTRTRAPRWIQTLGMEWFYRLVHEPQRLWKRYLIRGPRALVTLWKSEHAEVI